MQEKTQEEEKEEKQADVNRQIKNQTRKPKRNTSKRRTKAALALTTNQTPSQHSHDSGNESKVAASGTVHSYQLSQSVAAPRKLK